MKRKIFTVFIIVLMLLVGILVLTGCAKKEENKVDTTNNTANNVVTEKENNKETTTNNIANNETNDKTDEKDVIDYEIKEEDGKVIIKLGGVLTQVYYHDNEKVTDFELYMEYKDNQEAQQMYEYLDAYSKSLSEPDDTIDYIEVRGKYVVYNYNEKGFNEVVTYEQLVEYAKAYNIILDANNKKNEEDQISWPSVEYPRPDNCVLVSLVPDASGVKLIVKWADVEAAKAYKKVVKENGDYGIVEGDEVNHYAFQGTKVRISYDKNNESENYILFID